MTLCRNRLVGMARATAIAVSSLALSPSVKGADENAAAIEAGKNISFTRKLGNCVACHMMEGAESPGSIGPPLVAMKIRYPDKAKLREQIWDSTKINPETPMPPFGKYEILTEEQIDQVVEFVYTL